MGRPRKPCGTDAAYRRHLRDGEPPCPACRRAARDARRDRRDHERHAAARQEPTQPPLITAPAPPAPPGAEATERETLEYVRAVLVASLDAITQADPSRVPAITRELRATTQALRNLDRIAPETDTEDEFTRARQARAAARAASQE